MPGQAEGPAPVTSAPAAPRPGSVASPGCVKRQAAWLPGMGNRQPPWPRRRHSQGEGSHPAEKGHRPLRLCRVSHLTGHATQAPAASVRRARPGCLREWDSSAVSSALAKWVVAAWKSSSLASSSSGPACSTPAARQAGSDGDKSPSVWMSSTVATSCGFLKTCGGREVCGRRPRPDGHTAPGSPGQERHVTVCGARRGLAGLARAQGSWLLGVCRWPQAPGYFQICGMQSLDGHHTLAGERAVTGTVWGSGRGGRWQPELSRAGRASEPAATLPPTQALSKVGATFYSQGHREGCGVSQAF